MATADLTPLQIDKALTRWAERVDNIGRRAETLHNAKRRKPGPVVNLLGNEFTNMAVDVFARHTTLHLSDETPSAVDLVWTDQPSDVCTLRLRVRTSSGVRIKDVSQGFPGIRFLVVWLAL